MGKNEGSVTIPIPFTNHEVKLTEKPQPVLLVGGKLATK